MSMAMTADTDTTSLLWQAKGYQFSNIPPNIQAFVRSRLQLPELDRALLIPNPLLSVLDFIKAPLPPITYLSSSFPVPKNHSFFSTTPYSATRGSLLRGPVPPKGVIAVLLSAAKQQWLDGSTSILLPSLDETYPLWSIEYWRELQNVIHPQQTAWSNGIRWLQEDSGISATSAADVHATLVSLSTLAWSGTFSSSGDHVAFPKSTLLPFLSHEWLSDEHVDIMMAILEMEVREAHPGREILLINTIVTRAILQAHTDDKDGRSPFDVQGDTFLHRFGTRITTSSELGGVFHVRGNHWVSVAVDIHRMTIIYGDPASQAPDNGIVSALRWLICKFLGISEDKFTVELMPTPRQDFALDSWNCAIFSENALSSFLLLQRGSNASLDGFDGDLGRLAMLRKIIARLTATVSPLERVLPLSHFTIPPLEHNTPSPPITPPPTERLSDSAITTHNVHAVSVALTRLSVSPEKPCPTKRKATKPPKSVLAPIFQPKSLSSTAKAAIDNIQCDAKKQKPNSYPLLPLELESGVDDEDTSSLASNAGGRPRLDILDGLTVELSSVRGRPRRYRCAGSGCLKIWSPRTRIRVLQHCKRCLKMTPAQRQQASTASASSSPGALVAADEARAGLEASKIATPSTLPSSGPLANQPPRADVFFGAGGRRQMHNAFTLAVVKLVAVGRLPVALVDTPEFKSLVQLVLPSYSLVSSTRLMEDHIMSEQERVRQLQIAFLKTQKRVTVSFDGGSTRSGDAFYTVHATTATRKVVLLEGEDCTAESHTGEWIARFVLRAIDESMGRSSVIAASSDNTGNTRVAREILEAIMPNIFNLPDPMHHLNNTWKNIVQIEIFSLTVKQVRATITYFKHSNYAKARLNVVRTRLGHGPGLESIGKTRFVTIHRAGTSVLRNLPAIRELSTTGDIEIPKYNDIFIRNTPATLQFEMRLNQLLSIGDPIARAIECLEATRVNPADVYKYWLAIVAYMKRTLTSSMLPDDVCDQVRGIMITRWDEFFISGPTNAYLSAFYLNPNYVQSDIFKNPNPLSFNITLPARVPPRVPPGIRCPKTFMQVGASLLRMLAAEVNHGSDPFLTAWKGKPAAFTKAFQAQFTAYAQKAYPFTTPLGQEEDPLNWWTALEGTTNSGILAAIAIKLYSAVPHSMAEERTMSVVTMLNSAQRNRQKVDTIVSLAQIRGYYRGEVKQRKTSRPHPVLKFYEIERLIHTIDNDQPRPLDDDDDESDNDDDMPSLSTSTIIPSSDVLPFDNEADEVNLMSYDLEDLLAAAPVRRPTKEGVLPSSVTSDVTPEEDGGDFTLGAWV